MAWLEDFVKLAAERVDERVIDALNARGVSDDQIRNFQVGYVNKILPSLSYPEDFLKWSCGGSRLEDMYCFPVTNVLGEIRGFQCRPVNREIRGYSDYFVDTGEPALFGLAQAAPYMWELRSGTVVEGVFDLFPVQRHDPTVVATLTARVPESFLRTLKRMCRRVVLGYDNDHTGRKHVRAFMEEQAGEFDSLVDIQWKKITMLDGKISKDPGDLWEIWGDKELGDFIRKHVN